VQLELIPTRRCLRWLWLAACTWHCGAGAVDANSGYDEEPFLEAATLVPPSLLNGPGYRVDSKVEIRGFSAHFIIDTPFGPLLADSAEMLAIRVGELPAIENLDKIAKSEVFAKSAAGKLNDSGKAVAQLVSHPIDSVVGLPAGVARYFSQRLEKYSAQAQKISDRSAMHFGNDGDPYAASAGPMTAAREHQPTGKAWYQRVFAQVDRQIKSTIDYSKARRTWAATLGVDPYSSNPLVHERLDRLAWAGAAGSYGMGAAIGTIGGATSVLLSTSGRVNKLVWELPPEDLRVRNQTRLLTMCHDAFVVRLFLHKSSFSPSIQTSVSDSLQSLQLASGCDDLLELALGVRSEVEARFLANALRLLERNVGDAAHGATLLPIGASVGLKTAGGELFLPLPVDYLSWTQQIERYFDSEAFSSARHTLLVGGDATPRAQRELTQRGWNVVLRAPYAGAPPYVDALSPE
jgi:hypothetical protein